MKPWLLLIILMAFCCQGADTSRSFYLGKSSEDRFIGERQSSVWTFGPVQPGGRTILEFEHRIDFPRLGGWNPCVLIEVNGGILQGMGTRTVKRILNKELITPGHIDFGSFRACVDHKFYSLYSPDFEQAKKRYRPENEEAYRLKLDISDLVSEKQPNQVTIRFGACLTGFYKRQNIKRKPALVIHNLTAYREKEPSLLKKQSLSSTDYIVMKKKQPLRFSTVLKDNGDIAVAFSGAERNIASRYSVPGGGFNQWKSFQVKGLKLQAANDFYDLDRTVIPRENRIDVHDRLTSRCDKLIGIRLRYETSAAGCDIVHLAGDASPMAVKREGGRNPSMFLAEDNSPRGLGIVAVDDVFRVQNIQYWEKDFTGIGSDSFALSPEESRVVEFSIYPVNSRDYFDFINEVRKDWNVNFPIEGNFTLSMGAYYREWTKETARRLSVNRGLTMRSLSVLFWRPLGGQYSRRNGSVHGFGLMLDKVRQGSADGKTYETQPMRDFVRTTLAKCKEYTPDLNRFIYVHNQYCQEEGDLETYKDCVMTDEKGKSFSKNYTYHLFVPTLNNKFGRKNFLFIKYLLDNYDLEGIYNDEFTFTHRRRTYSMWDGVSVDLDDKNQVVQKFGFVPLLKLDYTLNVLNYVLNERGKKFVANFSPETRSELQFHFPRFEETYYSSWILLSHLYTPIQLGDILIYSNTSSKECLMDVRNALRKGALYYHYHSATPYPTITSKMFPFTPVELHSGYLVGKERILTIYSGEFGIPGETAEYEAFIYDELGRLQKNYPYENIRTADGVKCRIRLKKDFCAALVKKVK